MLQRAVNYWKGHVKLRVVSGFPERVLNICAARQIPFWGLEWEDDLTFTFTMTRKDYARLQKAAERMDCTIHVVEKEGMPYLLRRFRRRYALVIGLGLCLALSLFGSFFIWDFTIEGNEAVREEEILRALEKYGVSLGTFGYGIDSSDLRNHILLEIPELSYIAVNVRGCRAYVQVRERQAAPELVNKREPGNTVARRDALVTAIQPYDGQKMVLPGTMVQEGALLISGVTDDEQAGTRFLRGMGKVYGRTWYTLRCQVPAVVEEKQYTGEEHVRFALCWGNRRINLYAGGSPALANCDKTVERTPLTLPGGIALPITLVKETYRVYEIAERERTQAEAEELGRTVLEAYLLAGLDEGTVEEAAYTSIPWEGSILTELNAECQEQIGIFVPIPKEEAA